MPRVNLADATVKYESEDPDGFRVGMARFGPDMGAQITGTTLYELPPGELLCPYHLEYGEEEWLLVISGRPFLRTPDGTEDLEPLDLAFFPRGPEGAHQVGNRAGAGADVVERRLAHGYRVSRQRQGRALAGAGRLR